MFYHFELAGALILQSIFQRRCIMVDVNFLETNWQTKLIKYQTTYTMYAEQCTLSE